MEKLEIAPTYSSPKVIFDPQKSYFLICGSSILENPDEFYKPLLDWIDTFMEDEMPQKLEFTFDISCFNAASSKRLLRFIQKLKEINNQGGDVYINWLYNENDFSIYEIGNDFSAILQIPFNFVKYSDSQSRNNSAFSAN